MVVLGGSTR